MVRPINPSPSWSPLCLLCLSQSTEVLQPFSKPARRDALTSESCTAMLEGTSAGPVPWACPSLGMWGWGEFFSPQSHHSTTLCWQQQLLPACPAVASKGLPCLMGQVEAGTGACGKPALCPHQPFTLSPEPQVLSLHCSPGKNPDWTPQGASMGTPTSLAICGRAIVWVIRGCSVLPQQKPQEDFSSSVIRMKASVT